MLDKLHFLIVIFANYKYLMYLCSQIHDCGGNTLNTVTFIY